MCAYIQPYLEEVNRNIYACKILCTHAPSMQTARICISTH